MTDEPEVRIGTPEREAAQERLNEHFSLGRLDVPEFEERSTAVSGARTRGELEAVFRDLPAATTGAPSGAVQKSGRPWQYAVIGAMPIIAVILFFVLGAAHVEQAWLVFLLIPLAGALFGGGEYRERDRRRQRRIDRHRD